MASAGYGVEATVESMWDTTWDTTRFGHINAAIGERFNFWINDDSGTDITDTKITGLLAAESNDLFAYWNALAKVEKTVQPWDFIAIWIRENLAGDGFLNFFRETIDKCQRILANSKIELVQRDLPSSTSDW